MTGHVVSGWESQYRRVTVEKALERPDGETVVITVTITSNADEPLEFRIVDDLPGDAGSDAIGFHPTYKRDNWTVHEGSVQLVDAIAPGETRFAFYYLESDDSDVLRRIGPPTIADVTPIEPGDVAAYDPSEMHRNGSTVESTDVVADGPLPRYLTAVSGDERTARADDDPNGEGSDSETTAETTSDEGTATSTDDGDDSNAIFGDLRREYERREYEEFGEEVERYYASEIGFDELLGLEDADGGDGRTTHSNRDEVGADGDGADRGDGTDDRDAAVDSATVAEQTHDEPELDSESGFRWGRADSERESDESLVSALRRELERADPPDEDVAALREALGVDATGSDTARIRHLQSQVADLSAYTDALEAFLDEEGTAETVLATLEDDLARVDERLDEIGTQVAETARRQTELRDRVDELERTVEAVADVDATTEELSATATRHDDRLESLEETVSNLTRAVESDDALEDAVSNNEERLGDLEETIAEMNADHERVHDLLRTIAEEVTSASCVDGETQSERVRS